MEIRQKKDGRKLLKIPEAAQILRYEESTFRRMCSEGKCKEFVIKLPSGKIVIDEERMWEWVDARSASRETEVTDESDHGEEFGK